MIDNNTAEKVQDIRKVTERLRNLCARREYCSMDIISKAETAFKKKSYEQELVHDMAKEVLSVLLEEKYVDDFRYAAAFAREKASISGWGRIKIRYALLRKGVDKSVIDNALGEVDDSSAANRMERLLENRYRSLKDDPQCRFKLLRFALGRGYGYEESLAVIDRLRRD